MPLNSAAVHTDAPHRAPSELKWRPTTHAGKLTSKRGSFGKISASSVSQCKTVIMSHASVFVPIDDDTVTLFNQSAIIGKAK